jgi:hypothetical protein
MNFHLSLFHHHTDGWSEFEDVDHPTWMNERFKVVIKYLIASHIMHRGCFHMYMSFIQDVTHKRFIQKTVLFWCIICYSSFTLQRWSNLNFHP